MTTPARMYRLDGRQRHRANIRQRSTTVYIDEAPVQQHVRERRRHREPDYVDRTIISIGDHSVAEKVVPRKRRQRANIRVIVAGARRCQYLSTQ